MIQRSSGMDESAFRAFYESTRQPLWSYIIRSAGDAAQADDIFQESYVRFIQNCPATLQPMQQRAYLFRTASNLLIDFFRRHKRLQSISETNEETLTDPRSQSGTVLDIQHDLKKVFDQLTQQERSLLWLAYVEEYPHREIAEMLKVGEKSVKVLLFRAKQRMLGIVKRIGVSW